MTDYNLFPPIRFRFYGDKEQAKGRIPQARTQMAQMIRRMEGLGRDSGQWQGEMPDGTKFRIAKMGDVHVADIFGVAPPAESVMPPVSDASPDVMMPEMPETPSIQQREILMRPHGELFGGDGDYLWVGVEVDYSALPEDRYRSLFTYLDMGGYPPFYDGTGDVYVKALSLPEINIMLFEPGWNDTESKATVLQTSRGITDDTTKPSSAYKVQQKEFVYPGNGFADTYTFESYFTEENETQISVEDNPTIENGLAATLAYYFVSTPSGAYTGWPYVEGGPENRRVDAFVTVDSRKVTKSKSDFINSNKISDDLYKFGNFSYAPYRYYLKLTYDRMPDGVVGKRIRTEERYKIIEDDYIGLDFGFENQSEILSGTYEVRILANDLYLGSQSLVQDRSFGYDESLPCKVYIQVGRDAGVKQYDVSIPSLYNVGIFETAAWFETGTPTPVTDTWYPGCWLIDIKNKTIIHETDPANLGRDWFTQ